MALFNVFFFPDRNTPLKVLLGNQSAGSVGTLLGSHVWAHCFLSRLEGRSWACVSGPVPPAQCLDAQTTVLSFNKTGVTALWL